MGCGGSVGNSSPGDTKVDALDHNSGELACTWATKTVDGRKKTIDELPLLSDTVSTATTTAGKSTPAGSARKPNDKSEQCIVQDADTEDDEIEIIDEGRKDVVQAIQSAANWQEAPYAFEADIEAQQKINKAAAMLSKKQQEEAAKLAEQRKRFDNQRFQRDTCSAVTSLTASTGPSSVASVSPRDPRGPDIIVAKGTVVQSNVIAHHSVLALNQETLNEELPSETACLPGGIFDTPREEQDLIQVGVPRNNHERFDDDDERLMKEILDSVEGF